MRTRIFLFLLILPAGFLAAQGPDWQTFFEISGGTETPRYAETMAYCRRLAEASPMIHLASFGKSAQGRELPLLIVDRDGFTDPASIHAAGRTLLLIQACIHAGECEGKDAGMMLIRDLAITGTDRRKSSFPPVPAGLLDRVSVVFIPVFNVDGHERFGPFNRINQNGPVEMGWRSTAVNLNLNRDFLKADAPEMKAWLQMFNAWMPDFFIDTHTTDGADYRYVLTYLVEVYGGMDEGLTAWSKETFIPGMEEHMKRAGFPVFPYVGFRNWHDPRSGLITEVAPPMLSQGYTALRNRPGLLIETHMLKPYKQRVEATYECILAAIGILARESKTLNGKVAEADRYVSDEGFLRTPFPLRFETRKDDSTLVEFLGVKYTSEKSDLSGGEWFNYSKDPETMTLPYFSSTHPSLTVSLPYAYIVPAEWTEVIDRLKLHGLRMVPLSRETAVEVSSCRLKNPSWQQNPYEGRHTLNRIEYDEFTETRTFAAGSMLVEVMQPAGRIIPHLLEPKGNGSLLSWGFFDAIFEQKEYGESYVMEKLAREMLARDPALRKEFGEKMAADSLFAKNPRLILNWFYNRSAWADPRKGVYPVGRIFDKEQAVRLRQ